MIPSPAACPGQIEQSSATGSGLRSESWAVASGPWIAGGRAFFGDPAVFPAPSDGK
jgi:hypothetical protein